MDTEQNNQQDEKDESEPYSFSDEVTKNKIKRHIHDKNDIITEEDIARVKIPGDETPEVEPGEKKEKKEKGKKAGKKDIPTETPGEGKPITPWDIID